jgi:poly-gamma-glutamate synthesis protein (capsule biosynthesis protein)
MESGSQFLYQAQIEAGNITLSHEPAECCLTIAGDLCPVGKPESLLANKNYSAVWGNLPELLSTSDLSIANLECPLTDSFTPIPKNGPPLRAGAHCAEGIKASGLDVVTLANNHIMDMGERGLFDTITACQKAGFQLVGAGKNLEEAQAPLITTVNHVRIAILAFAEREFSIAGKNHAGACPVDIIDNYQQITRAKELADFVLIIYHGGNEYYPLPNPTLAKTCRFFVDLGANAVICHHTHVPSGLEIYQETPIIYSTGNFLFDWPGKKPAAWYKGYLVSLKINRSGVVNLSLIPYSQCLNQPGVLLMDGKEKQQMLSEIARLSAIIAMPDRLQEEWDKHCKTQSSQYMAMIFSSNPIEQRLLVRLGFLQKWKIQKKHVGRILNFMTCQSLRDIVEASLELNFKR